MTISRWIIGLAALAATAASAAAFDLDPEGRRFARELSDDDFLIRQAAETRLMQAANAGSLPLLSELAGSDDAEVSSRAMRLIERMMVRGTGGAEDAAERELERIGEAPAHAGSSMARERLLGLGGLREHRAVEALRELGAKVDYGPDLALMNAEYRVQHAEIDPYRLNAADAAIYQRCLEGLNDENARRSIPQTVGNVMFTTHWQGKPEDLWHLSRLRHVKPLQVYVMRGSGVSVEEVQRLSQGTPMERGPSLGVKGGMPGGCIISEVLEGGAAEAAGLVEGDRVLQIGSQRIDRFEQLITAIADFNVGDTVTLKVQRRFGIADVKVTLGDWSDIDTASSLWTPTALEARAVLGGPMFVPIMPKQVPIAPRPVGPIPRDGFAPQPGDR